jgi:hypothetical protein
MAGKVVFGLGTLRTQLRNGRALLDSLAAEINGEKGFDTFMEGSKHSARKLKARKSIEAFKFHENFLTK